MRNPTGDYQQLRLRASDPPTAAEWIRNEIPPAIRGGWCLSMLDNALTDTFPGNHESAGDFQTRLGLAVVLLRLAEEPHTVQQQFICEWHIRFAREAIEKGLETVPESMTPDAVSRRALGLFQLTRQQALITASAERAAELRALSGVPAEDAAPRPATAEARQLTLIRSLLPSLEWMIDKISDRESADEIRSWLDVREDLAIGEEVTRLRIDRMIAIARANRINNLRTLAENGASVAEMAYWLCNQLGKEFTHGSFSDYFEEAFGISNAELRNVKNWAGFGADGTLSDDEITTILDPLIRRLCPVIS
ncbi:MAG: hypothetical protein ACRDN0_38935 [Trebonia sp.]